MLLIWKGAKYLFFSKPGSEFQHRADGLSLSATSALHPTNACKLCHFVV